MLRLPTLTLALLLGALTPALAAPVPAGPTDEQLTEQILLLNDITTLDAMNAKLRALLKEPEKTKRMTKLAAKMQAVPGKPPLKFNAAVVLANAARVQRDLASAEALFGWSTDQAFKTKSVERLGMTYSYYIAILTSRKKYAIVEEVAQRLYDAQDLDGEDGRSERVVAILKLDAIVQLILAKSKQGEFNAAIDRVDQLISSAKGTEAIPFLRIKAFVLSDARRFDEAVSVYEEILKAVKDSELTAKQKEAESRDYRYEMTSILVDAGKVEKSIAVLRELVKEEPDSAKYANDLGFVLADHDKEFDYAEKLIRKALELDEEKRTEAKPADDEDDGKTKGPNAAYLDSLGWVLYKKGKYEEALKYLEQAASDPGDGSHVEIWDHVADTQLALGKSAAAIMTWEKALKLEDVSPRDKERRKVIEAKLKKAKANPPVAKGAGKAGK